MRYERNSDIWILASQRNMLVRDVSFELLARARILAQKSGGRVRAVLFGPSLPDSELRKLVAFGADAVYAAESPALADFLVDLYADALCAFAAEWKPAILLCAADSFGRLLAPYAAMRLHTGLTADCTSLDIDPDSGLLLQTRPAIGGSVMATIQCAGHVPQMATVRPHSMRPAPMDLSRHGEIFRFPAAVTAHSALEVKGVRMDMEECGGGLLDAEIVVTAGRGIRRAENLQKVFDFAKEIGAAVGATREVVDRGWLPYRYQIGLSGKTVAPKLYIALGVSGAVQHLAGMRTSGVIVAVNRDPDAQIFRTSDFGIRGDVLEVLPALARALKQGELQ